MLQIPEVPIFLYLLVALATYRLTRLLVADVILEDFRNWIWKKYPVSTKFGYLFTCYWCMSIWASVFLIGLFIFLPLLAYVVSLVLSTSAIVGAIAERID